MEVKIYNRSEIFEIARETTGQAKNKKWFEYRKNKLTASLFGQAIRIYDNPTPLSIAALNLKIAGGVDLSHIEAIQWGREFEDTAFASYRTQTGRRVSPTGVWLFPDGNLAASPDGLILYNENNPEPRGIIEVKCPYSVRFEHFADMQSNDNLPRYLTRDLELNPKHDYYHQVQGQLYATQAEYCDFVMWTTKSTYITRVYPDRKWVDECLPKLSGYLKRYYLPASVNASEDIRT